MEFEGIKLREVCHRKTNTDLTCAFFKKKKLRKRSDLWFTRGMGVRGVVKRYKLPGITLISSGGTKVQHDDCTHRCGMIYMTVVKRIYDNC